MSTLLLTPDYSDASTMLSYYFSKLDHSRSNNTWYLDFKSNVTLLLHYYDLHYFMQASDSTKVINIYYSELAINHHHTIIQQCCTALNTILKYKNNIKPSLCPLSFTPIYDLVSLYFFPKYTDSSIPAVHKHTILSTLLVAKPHFDYDLVFNHFSSLITSDTPIALQLKYYTMLLLFLPPTNKIGNIESILNHIQNRFDSDTINSLFIHYIRHSCDLFTITLPPNITSWLSTLLLIKSTSSPKFDQSVIPLSHLPSPHDSISFIFINQSYLPSHLINILIPHLPSHPHISIQFSFLSSALSKYLQISTNTTFINDLTTLLLPPTLLLLNNKHQNIILLNIKSINHLTRYATNSADLINTHIVQLTSSSLFPTRVLAGVLLIHSLISINAPLSDLLLDSLIVLANPTNYPLSFQVYLVFFHLYSQDALVPTSPYSNNFLISLYTHFTNALLVNASYIHIIVAIMDRISAHLQATDPKLNLTLFKLITQFLVSVHYNQLDARITQLLCSFKLINNDQMTQLTNYCVSNIQMTVDTPNLNDTAQSTSEYKSIWYINCLQYVQYTHSIHDASCNSIPIFTNLVQLYEFQLLECIISGKASTGVVSNLINVIKSLSDGPTTPFKTKQIQVVVSILWHPLLVLSNFNVGIKSLLQSMLSLIKTIPISVKLANVLHSATNYKLGFPSTLHCTMDGILQLDYIVNSGSEILVQQKKQLVVVQSYLKRDREIRKLNIQRLGRLDLSVPAHVSELFRILLDNVTNETRLIRIPIQNGIHHLQIQWPVLKESSMSHLMDVLNKNKDSYLALYTLSRSLLQRMNWVDIKVVVDAVANGKQHADQMIQNEMVLAHKYWLKQVCNVTWHFKVPLNDIIPLINTNVQYIRQQLLQLMLNMMQDTLVEIPADLINKLLELAILYPTDVPIIIKLMSQVLLLDSTMNLDHKLLKLVFQQYATQSTRMNKQDMVIELVNMNMVIMVGLLSKIQGISDVVVAFVKELGQTELETRIKGECLCGLLLNGESDITSMSESIVQCSVTSWVNWMDCMQMVIKNRLEYKGILETLIQNINKYNGVYTVYRLGIIGNMWEGMAGNGHLKMREIVKDYKTATFSEYRQLWAISNKMEGVSACDGLLFSKQIVQSLTEMDYKIKSIWVLIREIINNSMNISIKDVEGFVMGVLEHQDMEIVGELRDLMGNAGFIKVLNISKLIELRGNWPVVYIGDYYTLLGNVIYYKQMEEMDLLGIYSTIKNDKIVVKGLLEMVKCMGIIMGVYKGKTGKDIVSNKPSELELLGGILSSASGKYAGWIVGNVSNLMVGHSKYKQVIKECMVMYKQKELENKQMGLMEGQMEELYDYYQGDSYFA